MMGFNPILAAAEEIEALVDVLRDESSSDSDYTPAQLASVIKILQYVASDLRDGMTDGDV